MGKAGKKPSIVDANGNYIKWYKRNKEAVSKQRKKRYASDEKFREEKKKKSHYRYWTKVRDNKIIEPIDISKVTLKFDYSVTVVVNNLDDARYGELIVVPAMTIQGLAKLMGRSDQTIKLWERRGTIPKALWKMKSNRRLYSEDQVIAFLKCKHLLGIPTQNISVGEFVRSIHELLSAMPDGITVEKAYKVTVYGNCPQCMTIHNETVLNYKADFVRCPRCGTSLDGKVISRV